MIDPEVADISHTQAIVISLVLFIVAWAVYDGMYCSPLRHTGAWAEIVGITLLCLAIWGLTQVFSGRGAYVHVGAMIGTIMVANVWMITIPGQRKLVEATKAGTPLDARLAFNAKQRSVHNNYLTLPVVFIMMSSHYPGTYGHEYNWLILIATFAQVYEILVNRCVSCHTERPTDENFDKAPKNVMFDTPRQIKSAAARIRAVSVLTKTMPLGNQTKMTAAERTLLGRWIAAGAAIE